MDLRRSFTTAAAGLLVAVPVALLPGTGGPSSGDEGPDSHADRGDRPVDTAGQAPGEDETHEGDGSGGDDGRASFRLRALGGPSGTERHDAGDGPAAADDPRSPDGDRDGPTGSAEDDAPGGGSSDAPDDGSRDGSESGTAAPDGGSEDGSSDPDGSSDDDADEGSDEGSGGGPDDGSGNDSGDEPDDGSGDDPSADADAGVSGGVEA